MLRRESTCNVRARFEGGLDGAGSSKLSSAAVSAPKRIARQVAAAASVVFRSGGEESCGAQSPTGRMPSRRVTGHLNMLLMRLPRREDIDQLAFCNQRPPRTHEDRQVPRKPTLTPTP